MPDLFLFLVITLGSLWLFQRWRDRRYILLCIKFSTVWRHIILGWGLVLTSKGTIRSLNYLFTKFGKNVLCYIGPFPILLSNDPETIKDIFNAKQCVNRPYFITDSFENVANRGLLSLREPHWSNERRIANTAFNNKNLMSFIPIFNDEVNNILKRIDKAVDEKLNIPLLTYFREFTMAIATRTTIGRKVEKTRYSTKYFAECFNEFSVYMSELTLNNIYAIGFLRKFAQMTYFKASANMVNEMLALIEESFNDFSTKRGVDPSYETEINTAAEYLAKGVQQNKMESRYVISGLFHIFLGSFETTSASLYFILIMLGLHPEYQERAYEEICNLFPEDDDEQFEVTYEHISQMVFLDMVMNETMRVLPIIPQVAREIVDQDLTLSNGIVLPKGLRIVIDIYSLHHSKEIWGPDADKFNPDNFLPEEVESRHPYSFIPFMKGLRFCIGWRYAQLSLKVALAKIIKRYKFTTHCKLEDLKLENHVSSQLSENPPILVERRNKKKCN